MSDRSNWRAKGTPPPSGDNFRRHSGDPGPAKSLKPLGPLANTEHYYAISAEDKASFLEAILSQGDEDTRHMSLNNALIRARADVRVSHQHFRILHFVSQMCHAKWRYYGGSFDRIAAYCGFNDRSNIGRAVKKLAEWGYLAILELGRHRYSRNFTKLLLTMVCTPKDRANQVDFDILQAARGRGLKVEAQEEDEGNPEGEESPEDPDFAGRHHDDGSVVTMTTDGRHHDDRPVVTMTTAGRHHDDYNLDSKLDTETKAGEAGVVPPPSSSHGANPSDVGASGRGEESESEVKAPPHSAAPLRQTTERLWVGGIVNQPPPDLSPASGPYVIKDVVDWNPRTHTATLTAVAGAKWREEKAALYGVPPSVVDKAVEQSRAWLKSCKTDLDRQDAIEKTLTNLAREHNKSRAVMPGWIKQKRKGQL